MSRGSKPGERRGGRAPGVPNKRTLELLAPVGDTSAVTSKEVMRQAMHLHWAARFTDKGAPDWQHIAAAVECAAKVAPYEHPRLIASAVTVRRPDEMSDD